MIQVPIASIKRMRPVESPDVIRAVVMKLAPITLDSFETIVARDKDNYVDSSNGNLRNGLLGFNGRMPHSALFPQRVRASLRTAKPRV